MAGCRVAAPLPERSSRSSPCGEAAGGRGADAWRALWHAHARDVGTNAHAWCVYTQCFCALTPVTSPMRAPLCCSCKSSGFASGFASLGGEQSGNTINVSASGRCGSAPQAPALCYSSSAAARHAVSHQSTLPCQRAHRRQMQSSGVELRTSHMQSSAPRRQVARPCAPPRSRRQRLPASRLKPAQRSGFRTASPKSAA
jgi:hypothetical protein